MNQTVEYLPVGRTRRYAVAAAIALLVAAPTWGAEPEEISRDPEGAEVRMKGFISDLETIRLAEEEGPGLELPKTKPAPKQSKAEPEKKKAEPAKPAVSSRSTTVKAKSEGTDQLERRGSSGDAKPTFPPVRVAEEGKKESPKSDDEAKVVKLSDKPTDKKPGKTADKKKLVVTETKKVPETKSSSRKSEKSSEKPAKAVADKSAVSSRPSGNSNARKPQTAPILARGDLTVSLNEGGMAAIRPSNREPFGARYPAARISNGSYSVEGTVTGILPRPDGRLHVLVTTRSRETVQIVVSGRYAGQTLQTGEFVRLQGDRIGGTDRHPVVEVEESAISAPAPMPAPMPGPPMYAPAPMIYPGGAYPPFAGPAFGGPMMPPPPGW